MTLCPGLEWIGFEFYYTFANREYNHFSLLIGKMYMFSQSVQCQVLSDVNAYFTEQRYTRFSHYRVAGRVTEFADPNNPTETRLDAAVAMRVYSISAGRTLH